MLQTNHHQHLCTHIRGTILRMYSGQHCWDYSWILIHFQWFLFLFTLKTGLIQHVEFVHCKAFSVIRYIVGYYVIMKSFIKQNIDISVTSFSYVIIICPLKSMQTRGGELKTKYAPFPNCYRQSKTTFTGIIFIIPNGQRYFKNAFTGITYIRNKRTHLFYLGGKGIKKPSLPPGRGTKNLPSTNRKTYVLFF